MIEAQRNAFLLAGRSQFLQRIALKWSGLDTPIGKGGWIKRKTIVMLRRDADVFHSGTLGEAHPCPRVKFDRVELRDKLCVIGGMDLHVIHNPFTGTGGGLSVELPGGLGIKPPMNEHAEARFAEPFHAGVASHRGLLFVRIARIRSHNRLDKSHRQHNPKTKSPKDAADLVPRNIW